MNDIKIFPNPVQDFLFVENKNPNALISIALYDVKGVLIQNFEGDVYQINTSMLPNGIYFLKLNGFKNFVLRKVVKM